MNMKQTMTIGIISANRQDMLASLLRSLPMLRDRCRVLIIENSFEEGLEQELRNAVEFLGKTGFDIACFQVPARQSMFKLRQQLLEECTTKYMWMLDDDVALINDLNDPLRTFFDKVDRLSAGFGFIQGSKIDIRNTEGYDDWHISESSPQKAPGDIPKWFYNYDCSWASDTCVMDCGNVFLNVKRALEVGGFKAPEALDKKGYTSEDVLLGARLASVYPCLFVSDLKVFHFPRQKMGFKTKDPRWLINAKEDLGISDKVKEQLNEFYKSKFGS